MKKQKVYWNDAKLDELRKLYPTHTIEQLSEKLGISVGSIHNKIKRLNELCEKQYGRLIFFPKKSKAEELEKRALERWAAELGDNQVEDSKAA
jgi:hypothetical protein